MLPLYQEDQQTMVSLTYSDALKKKCLAKLRLGHLSQSGNCINVGEGGVVVCQLYSLCMFLRSWCVETHKPYAHLHCNPDSPQFLEDSDHFTRLWRKRIGLKRHTASPVDGAKSHAKLCL